MKIGRQLDCPKILYESGHAPCLDISTQTALKDFDKARLQSLGSFAHSGAHVNPPQIRNPDIHRAHAHADTIRMKSNATVHALFGSNAALNATNRIGFLIEQKIHKMTHSRAIHITSHRRIRHATFGNICKWFFIAMFVFDAG